MICKKCKGTGRIENPRWDEVWDRISDTCPSADECNRRASEICHILMECPDCHGKGTVDGDLHDCGVCGGNGVIKNPQNYKEYYDLCERAPYLSAEETMEKAAEKFPEEITCPYAEECKGLGII